MASPPIDLTDRLDTMVAALRASPRVRLHEHRRQPLSARSATIDAVVQDLRDADISLHPALTQCWLSFADFAVHWESADISDTTTVVGGEMGLSYLYDVATHDTDLVAEHTPESQRAILRSLRVIDDQPRGGNGTLAAIRVEENQLMPDTWFFDVRTGVHALDVDYCGYLDALITTKGGYGWQYLYADVDLTKPEQGTLREQLSLLIAFLENAFPDVDYRALRDRLTARKTHRKSKRS
jgi:hypothetical protein